MSSLIGGHFTKNGLEQLPARVVLSINGNGLGGDETHPDTLTVFRSTLVFPDGEAPPDFNTFQPGVITWDQYGRYWFKERTADGGNLKATWDKNPADLYQILNEQGGGEDDDPSDGDSVAIATQRAVDIERAILPYANADDKRCTVLNLAGGSPGDFELWKSICAPFIMWAWENGRNVYARHCYADWFVNDAGQINPGQPARVIAELGYLRSLGYGGGIIISECGLFGGYGVADYPFFEQQVKRWETALLPYIDILIGLCWWEFGHTEKFQADYTNHFKILLPYLQTATLPRWQPKTVEEPMEHKAIVVKVAQDVTAEEWQEAAVTSYPFRHTLTASHDDMMTILAGGNEESFVKFSHPDRDEDAVDLVEAAGYGWQPLYGNGQQPELPYLNTEPLSQRDLDWANVTLGQPTGHDKTIGSWGCLLVAYTCLARFWGLTTRLPGAENAHYVSRGAFSAQFIQPAALRTAYPESVAYDGFLARSSSAMRPKIREWIDNGWPVPARVDFDPTDSDFDQHWVLLVGYEGETDFYMMDPWWGDIVTVNSRYPIAGSDVLEAIFYRPLADEPEPEPEPAAKLDLLQFLRGDGRIFEMQHATGGQERNQVQPHPTDANAWYICKGENEGHWELWRLVKMVVDGEIEEVVCLDTDTSPANASDGTARYYKIRKNGGLAPKYRRFMAIGETFGDGGHTVQFYRKSDCQPHPENSGPAANTTTIIALHPSMTLANGIVKQNVLEVQENSERQFWCIGNGRVKWISQWGSSQISEEHGPGQRPDIKREVIGCLG